MTMHNKEGMAIADLDFEWTPGGQISGSVQVKEISLISSIDARVQVPVLLVPGLTLATLHRC